jgi:general secretion pathway protein H
MTPRAASQRPARGFTLIEMMVVLGIAALVLAVAVPSLTGLIGARPFAEARERVVTDLRIARGRAIEQRQTTFVSAARLADDSGVLLAVSPPDGIRFHPDGSSSGGRIVLTSGRREAAVTVDWLTGRVRVVD